MINSGRQLIKRKHRNYNDKSSYLIKNNQNYHIILQKEFVNVQNGLCFYHPIYEHMKALGNKEKTAETRFYLFWQGHLCNSRSDFIRELLLFGKDVKFFLNKYMNVETT